MSIHRNSPPILDTGRERLGPAMRYPATSALRQIRAAAVCWFVAIAAGVFETVLAVTDALSHDPRPGADVAVGVTVRLVVFAAATFLTLRLRRGGYWARSILAVLLGVLGLSSLLVGPIQWLTEGHSISAAMAGADTTGLLFAACRIVHITAVLTAMVLMFRPAANAYFREAHGRRLDDRNRGLDQGEPAPVRDRKRRQG